MWCQRLYSVLLVSCCIVTSSSMPVAVESRPLTSEAPEALTTDANAPLTPIVPPAPGPHHDSQLQGGPGAPAGNGVTLDSSRNVTYDITQPE